jgi:hypothetical protein
VTVPLDRQNPWRVRIDIHYPLVPRTDTTRPAVGTIVPNVGGPGHAVIANARLYLQPLAALRRDRDLLLIDPRRTGQSDAVTCPSVARHDPLSLDLTTIAGLCGADLSARSGLYGSAAVADDIDAVRVFPQAGQAGSVRRLLWHVPHAVVRRALPAARSVRRAGRCFFDCVRSVGPETSCVAFGASSGWSAGAPTGARGSRCSAALAEPQAERQLLLNARHSREGQLRIAAIA